MTNEAELNARPNGGGALIATGDPIWISVKDSKAKYSVSGGTLADWAKRGIIRKNPDAVAQYAEPDIQRRISDPEYQRFALQRRKTLAEGRGRVGQGKRSAKPTRKYQRRALAAQPEAAQASAIAHHVAYLAGRTDEFISGYARMHQLPERELMHALGQLLTTR